MAKATKFDKREPESNSEYSSSSEDVEEDEDGEELTPALDAAILSTLGRIRRKEGVYGSENVLAEALKEAEQKAKGLVNVQRKQRGNDKPFTLSDHHRAALLSGLTGEEEVEEPLTNVQAEIKLRHEAINAFHQLAGDEADDEDESGGGFLAKRVKDDNEDGDDEEEYRKFMLDVGGGEAEVRRILGTDSQSVPFARQDVEEEEGGEEPESAPQKKVKGKAPRADLDQMKAKADDDFLMNYILNRGWIDKTIERVPTYKDIVGEDKPAPGESEEGNNQAGPSHPWGELEEEDEFDEKAEEFETAYNFRFEEPGSTSISTHPRNIDSLVRRPDDARKSKRQAKAERKAAERAVQEEETRKQKGKKRREMEKQLEQLKAELGDSVDWKALEKVVDGEWDEEEWERVIGGMLSGAADAEDEAKPSWDDDVDYGDYGDEEEGEEYEEAYAQEIEDDAPINMDADFIDEQPQKKRKKDKKGKGRAQEEDVVEDLTVADRALKVKETMEEYQKLDHEDIIGDLPTRFKYASGPKIDFGLTPAEILLATDAELNALASVKHIAPYRRGGMGKTAQGMNRRVRDLKEQLRQRKWGEEEIPASAAGGSGSNSAPVAARKPVQAGSSTGVAGAEARDADGKKKRLGKKQRQKAKLAQESEEPIVSSTAAPVASSTQEGKRPRDTIEEVSVQAESAGQEGSSKKRRKKNKNKSQAVIEP